MQPITVQMSGGGHGHSNVEHFLNTIEPVLYYNGEPVITSLLDFFRFPRQQTAFAVCGTHGPVTEQVVCLQQALFAAVQCIRPYSRFLPYIQLHEFEALLFADEAGHELHVTGIRVGVAAVINDYPWPEDINSRPERAPSKELSTNKSLKKYG